MGATFNRLKTWISETLNASDVNAEFDNILNNLTPAGIDDYAANVTEFQTQTDPGEVGSESLPLSLSEEIARLRYEIAEIKGTTYHYTSPVTSLASLNTAFGNGGLPRTRLVSGATTGNSNQSVVLVPEGSGNGNDLVIAGAATDLVYYVDGAEYTLDSDVTIASTNPPPTSNNTALVNDAFINDQIFTKYMGLYGTSIPIDTIGSEITSLNGKLAAFKLNNGVASEYFLATVDTTNSQLKDIKRGYFFDENGAAVLAVDFADGDTITLMNIAWVFLTSAGAASVTYNEPVVSATQPSTPSNGDYWFDSANDTWKTYNGSAFVSAGAALVGIGIIDEAGDCVAARSEDYVKAYITRNTVEVSYDSATQLRSNRRASIGVYGTLLDYKNDDIVWDITSDLDTGAEASDNVYFFYLTESGVPKISLQAPLDMTSTRGGYYHPHETWRCVAQAWNDLSSNLDKTISYHTDDIRNAQAFSAVGSGDQYLYYWASPLMQFSLYNQGTNAAQDANIKLTRFPIYQYVIINSGATLGHSNRLAAEGAAFANPDNVVLHLVTNNDFVALGASSHQHGQGFEVTTLAMSASSDTGALYTNEVYTSAQVRAIAYGKANLTTAGTWNANLLNFKALDDINICRKVRTTSSGTYTNTTTSETTITNMSNAFFLTGSRKIRFRIEPAVISTTTGAGGIGISDDSGSGGVVAHIRFFIGGTAYRSYQFNTTLSGTIKFPASCVHGEVDFEEVDTVGNYTITARAQVAVTNDEIEVENCALVIEEMPYDGTW